jgi:hypothetical protein
VANKNLSLANKALTVGMTKVLNKRISIAILALLLLKTCQLIPFISSKLPIANQIMKFKKSYLKP